MPVEKPRKPKERGDDRGITKITVSGYKSIGREQFIEVRPLTILAGANSSGKSSMMQPLLLLKQTLEASYDPGALLLSGPNVRFTSADQLLSRTARDKQSTSFSVSVEIGGPSITASFGKVTAKGLDLQQMVFSSGREDITLRAEMSHDDIASIIPSSLHHLADSFPGQKGVTAKWKVVRNRCFLELQLAAPGVLDRTFSFGGLLPGSQAEQHIRGLIHLPGLRGNPERTYPVTAVGSTFPGTFEKYVASVIARWYAEDKRMIENLSNHLQKLGLTWKVMAKPVDDTQVELRLGRLPRPVRGGAQDLVNIADHGFGASQTLPVLVALLVAERGQLVYLEQPEIHLHPRAQTALASILVEAANRGVRVVAETHSSLLVLATQALVAEGHIHPSKVKLHWFARDHEGLTEITSANLDRTGAYGNWPEDFAEVSLEAESAYLGAAESNQRDC